MVPEGTIVSVPVLADGRGLRDVPLEERWSHPRSARLEPRTGSELIQIFPSGRSHSLWIVRDGDHRLRGWYVNLEDPHVLVDRTISTRDGVLDIWIPAQTAEPEWKDEDELEAATRVGRVRPEQAAALRAEGERVFQERPWPTVWDGWLPPPGWTTPELPPGWDDDAAP